MFNALKSLSFHSKPLFTKLHHRRHTAMSLPSSSSSSSKRQFDVFLSFRGADTRHNFTDHLRQSLHRKGIDAFFDEKGQDLSVLFDRIEQSKMSIVVFSENYANSTWCLDELWKILQCSKKSGHGVIPIFYKVKKSDVEIRKGVLELLFRPLRSASKEMSTRSGHGRHL